MTSDYLEQVEAVEGDTQSRRQTVGQSDSQESRSWRGTARGRAQGKSGWEMDFRSSAIQCQLAGVR